MALEIKP